MIKLLEKHFYKIILAMWICALLELVTSYKYLVFLRREFALLILAGVFVMTLFLITDVGIKKLTLDIQLRGGILILPLFYMLIAHGSSLDSYAFQKRNIDSIGIPKELLDSSSSSDGLKNFQLPEAKGDSIPSTLRNLLEAPMLYKDKTVTVIGMVYYDPAKNKNRFKLFRFTIT